MGIVTSKTLGNAVEKHKVTGKVIDAILTGAFEGGSNYWADEAIVVDGDYKDAEYASEVVSRGGKLIIVENDESDDPAEFPRHELTLGKMLKGLQLYLDNGGKYDPEYVQYWDAGSDDAILQYALFGKVVYG